MKRVIILVSSVLCLVSCSLCVSSKTITCKGPVEERAVLDKDFTSVEVNGGFEIEFVQGAPSPVTVKTNSDAFEYLKIYVKDNGSLVIEKKDRTNIKTDICLISLSTQLLENFDINGAANFKVKGGYVSEKDFSIEVNGAGKIDLSGFEVPRLDVCVNGAAKIEAKTLTVGTLSVEINGTASAAVAGTAGKAALEVNGVGKIDASGLVCSDIKVEKNGLAKITLPSA